MMCLSIVEGQLQTCCYLHLLSLFEQMSVWLACRGLMLDRLLMIAATPAAEERVAGFMQRSTEELRKPAEFCATY